MKYVLISTIVFIILASFTYAVDTFIEPSELIFEDVLGSAEKMITVKTDSELPVQITISAPEKIKEWFLFEPESQYSSKASPAIFKVIVNVGSATEGIYETFLIINALTTGNGPTTTIISATSIKTNIHVTDQEITEAVIEDVEIKDVMPKDPIMIKVRVQNTGNVVISPYLYVEILNDLKTQTIRSTLSNKKTINAFGTDEIIFNLQNDLSMGEYWVRVTTMLGDNWIIGKRLIKFKITEDIQLEKEEKKIILTDEATALGLDWPILFLWGVLLVFVLLVLTKHKNKLQKLKK